MFVMNRRLVGSNFSQTNSFCDQRGITFVETVMAILIITISFLAISAGQMSSFTSLRKSAELKDVKTLANRILEDKYKDILSAILDDLDPEAKFEEYVDCAEIAFEDISSDDANGCYGIDTTYKDYKVTWRLQNEKDLGGAVPISLEGLILLELKIDWEDKGEKHSLSLASYLSCTYVINDDISTICPAPWDPDPI